jgi:TonB family protein
MNTKHYLLCYLILSNVLYFQSLYSDEFDDFGKALKAKQYDKAKEVYYSILENGIFDYSTWEDLGDTYFKSKLYEGAAISYLISLNIMIPKGKDGNSINNKLKMIISNLKLHYPGYNFSICPIVINNTLDMLDSFYYDGRASLLKVFQKYNIITLPSIEIITNERKVIEKLPKVQINRYIEELLSSDTLRFIPKDVDSSNDIYHDDFIPEPEKFIAVEVPPSCDLKQLQTSIVYPERARMANIEGKVIIRIWIDKNGKVKSPQVIYSDSILFNDSALKSVLSCSFTAAIQEGKPVGCWMTIPIKYTLQ